MDLTISEEAKSSSILPLVYLSLHRTIKIQKNIEFLLKFHLKFHQNGHFTII